MDLLADIIPAKTMGFELVSSEKGRVELSAPLRLNMNDKGTAFAGSISSILTLAGWAVLSHILLDAGFDAEVMVVKSSTEYVLAVRDDFRSVAHISAEESARVREELTHRGRSRACIQSRLFSGNSECAAMTAHYAVISR